VLSLLFPFPAPLVGSVAAPPQIRSLPLLHRAEAPRDAASALSPSRSRLAGRYLVTAARRHGGGQRTHRHARGAHGNTPATSLSSLADLPPLIHSLIIRCLSSAAHQPGHRAAVRHLHPRHHGVGEVHLRPRDLPAEQRRHHRHGHAHAAAPTPHHRRLRPHEPQHQDPRPQRFGLALPTARTS